MNNNTMVYIVDDDPGVRKSLAMVIQAAELPVAAYQSAEEFLAAHPADTPGCLVLDLRLTGMSGLQLLETLKARKIYLPVLMITGHGDVPAAVQSMKLGAIDFIEKPVEPRQLVAQVRAAIQRDQARRAREAEIVHARQCLQKLTDRERELLKDLAAGKSSKQIAAELGLSRRTIENHRANLLSKTGADNTAALVRLSVLAGIVEPLPESE